MSLVNLSGHSIGKVPTEDTVSPMQVAELGRTVLSRTRQKQRTPRFSVVEQCGPSTPFTLIQFPEKHKGTFLRRRDSKGLVTARSFRKTIGLNSTKASLFASIEAKSSLYGSLFSSGVEPKQSSEVETHPNEYNSQPILSLEDEDNLDLGIVPRTMPCYHCKRDTLTTVSLEMPTLSVWSRICCIADFVQCCTKESSWDKYQHLKHRCGQCRRVIGKVEPIGI